MNPRTIAYYTIGILLVAVLISVPFDQLVETNHKVSYTSDDENRIEITFGGPRVTWVTVACNITTDIHFMYPNGTWMAIHNVLLASIRSTNARYNYNGEHSTTIVEIVSEEPFIAYITYTYLVSMKMSYFERMVYSCGLIH
jgi:hypothetical protein